MKRTVKLMLLVLIGSSMTAANADEFKRERREGEKYADRNKAKDVLENKTAPALAVSNWQNTDGKELTLAGLKGKVVVLDFWGVWCGPCRAAMPHLRQLYEKHKDQGLVVIGVHTKNQGGKMADYVKEADLTWPIALDTEGETVKAFAVDSYPDYYLIDRKGDLRVADLANGDLDRAVEALLKE
jgi:thiol-disulfide isomerase/thioredoxin